MTGFDDNLLSRIEDAGIDASAPRQQRWLDGWIVRTAPGKAKRARCINAVAIGRLSVAEKLALADQIYRDAELPLVVRITPYTLPVDLDQQLAAAGMARFDDTRVMVAAIGDLGRDRPPPSSQPRSPAGVELRPLSASRFAEAAGELRGSTPSQRAAHAERLATSPVAYRGFVVERDGKVVGCGQYARAGDLVGLYDIHVAATARNRGIAGALCTRLIELAAGEGAKTAYLQVEADNAPARAVYARLGFRDAYAYHYRAPVDPR